MMSGRGELVGAGYVGAVVILRVNPKQMPASTCGLSDCGCISAAITLVRATRFVTSMVTVVGATLMPRWLLAS